MSHVQCKPLAINRKWEVRQGHFYNDRHQPESLVGALLEILFTDSYYGLEIDEISTSIEFNRSHFIFILLSNSYILSIV